jgi:hypothetical protein
LNQLEKEHRSAIARILLQQVKKSTMSNLKKIVKPSIHKISENNKDTAGLCDEDPFSFLEIDPSDLE